MTAGEQDKRIAILQRAMEGFVISRGDADEALIDELGREGLVGIQNWCDNCFIVITDEGEKDLEALLGR